MTGVPDQLHARDLDVLGHPPRRRGVAAVLLACGQQNRAAQVTEPLPDGRARALPGTAQELREPRRVVAEAAGPLALAQLARLRGEHRLLLPARHHLLDRAPL